MGKPLVNSSLFVCICTQTAGQSYRNVGVGIGMLHPPVGLSMEEDNGPVHLFDHENELFIPTISMSFSFSSLNLHG